MRERRVKRKSTDPSNDKDAPEVVPPKRLIAKNGQGAPKSSCIPVYSALPHTSDTYPVMGDKA